MRLKNGLYEQVVNRIISDNINDSEKLIDKEKIDDEESSIILAQYLAKIIRKGLSYVDNDKNEKVSHQIDIWNWENAGEWGTVHSIIYCQSIV